MPRQKCLNSIKTRAFFLLGLLAFLCAPFTARAQGADPLPSWNDGKAKQSIIEFVEDVTREGSPDFLPKEQRIATFANDGTLWVEQPMYVEVVFALDRLRELLPLHPEWRDQQPFKAALGGDVSALLKDGGRSVEQIVAAPMRE